MKSSPTIPSRDSRSRFGTCMMTRLLTLALLTVTISAQERTPWTTSRITGSPESPPAYVAEPLWTNLNLDNILEIAHLPEARRIFLVAQKGTILSLPDDTRNEPESIVFAELSKSIVHLTNVYGLTFQVKEGKRPSFVTTSPRTPPLPRPSVLETGKLKPRSSTSMAIGEAIPTTGTKPKPMPNSSQRKDSTLPLTANPGASTVARNACAATAETSTTFMPSPPGN